MKCAFKQIFFFNLEQNWWSDVNTVYVDINSYNMFLVCRFRCDPIILHRRQFSNAFNPLVVAKPFLSSNETGNHFPVSISFKSRQYLNTPPHLTLHESVVNNFAVNLEKKWRIRADIAQLRCLRPTCEDLCGLTVSGFAFVDLSIASVDV